MLDKEQLSGEPIQAQLGSHPSQSTILLGRSTKKSLNRKGKYRCSSLCHLELFWMIALNRWLLRQTFQLQCLQQEHQPSQEDQNALQLSSLFHSRQMQLDRNPASC